MGQDKVTNTELMISNHKLMCPDHVTVFNNQGPDDEVEMARWWMTEVVSMVKSDIDKLHLVVLFVLYHIDVPVHVHDGFGGMMSLHKQSEVCHFEALHKHVTE